ISLIACQPPRSSGILIVVVNDPSDFVVAFESGTLSRFQPLGVIRLPRAVTKYKPISVLGGKPLALRVVCAFTVPDIGCKLAKPVIALPFIVVRGASPARFATLLLSGHSIVSGGASASLVTLKVNRNSCWLSR